MKIRYLAILILIAFWMPSCGPDAPTDDIDRIVIRMSQEPNRLNPILQLSSQETELSEYVFVSLGDYDPITMEMVPVLITQLPTTSLIEDGPLQGGVRYDFEIVPEAVWDNGEPITGYDLAFTMKAALHPGIDSRGWKALFNDIGAVDVDPDQPKRFSVSTTGNYFLNEEGILSAEIYPRYFYDPEDALTTYRLADIKNQSTADSLMTNDARFAQFAENFASIAFSRETIQGAGPYKLGAWEAGQYIILERKADYWGSAYPDRTYLKANPQQIVFQILEDEATAVTQLKNGQLDVVSLSSAPYQIFDDLKADGDFSSQFQFFTPDIFQFYYLPVNNQDVRLAEVPVRQALSYLIDVERMVSQIEGGYARKINSIIHPSKVEYNSALPDIPYDPEGAIALLENAGWTDTDGDGVRDKVINGKKESLDLRIFITGSSLSQTIATIFKEEAAKVGVQIDIVSKQFQQIRDENLATGDFEFTTLRVRQSPAKTDPYAYWHSASIGLGGLNYARFSNALADEMIDVIRTSLDNEERMQAYQTLQEVFYNDYPVIMLYAPVERYVVSGKYDAVISSKKPGYFANAFRIKS